MTFTSQLLFLGEQYRTVSTCGVLALMESAIVAVIAVAGTLLGSAATYFIQKRMTEENARLSFQGQLRAERINAYSDFAGAISDFRGGQYDRWHREDENSEGQAFFEARLASYRLRERALHALSRVQLVAPSQLLAKAAVLAYDLTSAQHEAPTAAELHLRAGEAKQALQQFINLASRDVQQVPVNNEIPPELHRE
jgi:hypothetical protein